MIAKDIHTSPILHRCQHPRRVVCNGVVRYVPCNRCPSCLNYRSWRLSRRCQRESLNKDYCYPLFITLTYCDDHLPLFIRRSWISRGTGEIVRSPFYINPLNGSLIHVDNLDLNNLPYAPENADFIAVSRLRKFSPLRPVTFSDSCFASFDTSHIQLFIKRLRKRLRDKFQIKKGAFRYFIVSEYGERRHRPHYHGLLWCRSEEVRQSILTLLAPPPSATNSERLQFGLSSPWSYGITDCQLPKSADGTSKYIAGYINSLSLLNSNFNLRPLRPFYLASRNNSIGYSKIEQDSYERMEESYALGRISRPNPLYSRSSSDGVSVTNVLYSASIAYKFVPKCTAFAQRSFAQRVEKYSFLYEYLRRLGIIECRYSYNRGHYHLVNVDDIQLAIKQAVASLRFKFFDPVVGSWIIEYRYPFSPCHPLRDDHFTEQDMHCCRVCLDYCLRYDKQPCDFVKYLTDYHNRVFSYVLGEQCVQYSYLYSVTGNNDYLVASDLEFCSKLCLPDVYNNVGMCNLVHFNGINPLPRYGRYRSRSSSDFLDSVKRQFIEQEIKYMIIHSKEKMSHEKFETVCW